MVEFEKDIYPLIEGEVMVLFDRNSRNAKVIGSGNVAKRGDFKLIDRVEGFRSQFEDNAHIPKVKMFKFWRLMEKYFFFFGEVFAHILLFNMF